MRFLNPAALVNFEMMGTSELISCFLLLYVQPLLCIVGILFNSACLGIFVMVWNNRQYYRKTALIFYLGAVSVCSIAQLLLSFPVIVMPGVEQFIDDVKYPEEARVINDFNVRAVKMFYPLLMAANYVSIWLLVLVCAHRFHSICHPNSIWKGRLQFVRHSKLCIFIAIFAAIAVNAIRWFEMEKIGSKSLENGQLIDSELRLSLLYNIIQEGLLYGLAVYTVPMCLLVWLNYNTMRIITESSERRQQFQSRMPAEHRTALMTICVFCAFALCTTMAISLRLVIIVVGNMFEYAEFAWLPDVSNLLMNINTIVMPIVFFIFTRGFRDLFFALHHRPTNTNALFKLPK
uniref:G-protein coupled receptors family 1 profile domain-containing protein n=1 Tax=Globodera rostochiensis TaxID=31243 RepID=A0A914I2F9_GLORO